MESITSTISLSIGKIIGLIGCVRNDLIEDVMKDDQLSYYYKHQFNKEITGVKREFLKRELMELLLAPIDLVHYSKLIKQIKETNTASLTESNGDIFYQELQTVFNRYVY